MPSPRQYAVLGPLTSAVEARAFLGCEVTGGVPNADLPVVIVWLPDDVTKDAKQVARLQRETAFVTQLRHPNILRVHGLEHFEEGWARIVAFVDGETLSRLVAKTREAGRPVAARIAARILADACEGVHYAHEEGASRYAGRPIVHGGLRPESLFISYTGATLVSGYGAALVSTQQGSARDKYAYLAPEQIIGGKATASPATDIYALGAILYELLTGKPPFADAPDVERAVLTGDPPTIDATGLEGRLGNIASTALSKRGSDRFESAAAMKEAILTSLGDDTLATDEEVAELLGLVMPVDSSERVHRRSMLESAIDPDSVTILSRVAGSELPQPAPRRASSVVAPDPAERVGAAEVAGTAEQAAAEDAEPRLRAARPREEKTIVDGRPPQRREPLPREVTEISTPEPGPAREPIPGEGRPSQRPLMTGPVPTIMVGDEPATDAGVAASGLPAPRPEVESLRRELSGGARPSAGTPEPRTDEFPPPALSENEARAVLAAQEGLITDAGLAALGPRDPVLEPVAAALGAFPDAPLGQAKAPSPGQTPVGQVIPPFRMPQSATPGVLQAQPPGMSQPGLPFTAGQFVQPGVPMAPPGSPVGTPQQYVPVTGQQPTMQAMYAAGLVPGSLPPGVAPQGGLPQGFMPQGALPGQQVPQQVPFGAVVQQGILQPQGFQVVQPQVLYQAPPRLEQSILPNKTGNVPISMPPKTGNVPISMAPKTGNVPVGPGMFTGSATGNFLPGPGDAPAPSTGRVATGSVQAGVQGSLPGPGTTPTQGLPLDSGVPMPAAVTLPSGSTVPFRDGPPKIAPVALGAVPRAPMREQSAITRFDKKMGDSSKFTLIAILGGAIAMLAGLFYFYEPPADVKEAAQQETRHALPKDLVRAALENAKTTEKPPVEPAPEPEKATPPEEAQQGAKPGETAAVDAGEAPPVERFGKIELATEPMVDVYDETELLGRTPLTVKLTAGPHQLRFTDKSTGLNAYRSYKVKAGELTRDHIAFGTSELVIEAPEGASIVLNTRLIGKAPLDVVKIYEGKYHLKVTLDGKSWSDTFEAPAGRRINYKVELKN